MDRGDEHDVEVRWAVAGPSLLCGGVRFVLAVKEGSLLVESVIEPTCNLYSLCRFFTRRILTEKNVNEKNYQKSVQNSLKG